MAGPPAIVTEFGHDVFGHGPDQAFGHFIGCGTVSGNDDRTVERRSSEGVRIGDNHVAVSAVGSTREQHDVRRQPHDVVHIGTRQALSEAPDELRACAESCLARCLESELAHEPDRHHAKPARCAAGGEPNIEIGQPPQTLLQIGKGDIHADLHVGVDRGRSLPRAKNARRIQTHGSKLRVRAAEVDQ